MMKHMTRCFLTFEAAIFLSSISSVVVVSGQTICRRNSDLVPHQNGIWSQGFPYYDEQVASGEYELLNLCEGSVVIEGGPRSLGHDVFSICVEGRVTWEQLGEALDDYQIQVRSQIHTPAARTISVNGGMVCGSANVVLGPSAKFLYDMITTYTVDGVTYDADDTMTDRLLAASMGTIDGFCLDGFKLTDGPEQYRITREYRSPLWFRGYHIDEASIVFASTHSIFVEYHRAVEPGFFLSILAFPFSWIGMALNNFITTLPLPPWLIGIVPGFLGLTGLSRAFLVNGNLRLQDFPQPLVAPDVSVENWQIDTAWTTLQAAIDDGLFTQPLLPLNLGIVIKRIIPEEDTNGCWKEPTAAIDIQGPVGQEGILDRYVTRYLYPALAEHGDVGMHFGKRAVSNTGPFDAAIDFYANCGVSTFVNLTETECYHPFCGRNGTLNDFTYPAPYYEICERGGVCGS